jgi:UDP-2-acetamido-3-amino-2,3-dideoxy-glucuronate N-acetyltransferase
VRTPSPRSPFVHPSAIVDPGARIGPGCVLGQNVFVAATVVVGARCKIQNNVSLYDGLTLQDEVFVGPSAVFTNVVNPRAAIVRKHEFRPTVVETGATLGANCTIVCGNRIGAFALIGAGAVVTRDVPAHGLMAGVPARRIGWACRCGVTLPRTSRATLTCGACGDTYSTRGRGPSQQLEPGAGRADARRRQRDRSTRTG